MVSTIQRWRKPNDQRTATAGYDEVAFEFSLADVGFAPLVNIATRRRRSVLPRKADIPVT